MKKNNNLDEMQEQKLLHIEHNMAWLAFWGLFTSILGHILFLGAEGLRYLLGEWLVFMCLCIYSLVDCIRNGIWDRRIRPDDKKKSLLLCFAVCASFSAVMGIVAYRNTGELLASAGIFGFFLVILMLSCWTFLSIAIKFYKMRVNQLENVPESE